jgi:hypothetical protein
MPNGNILEEFTEFLKFSLPLDQEQLLRAVIAAQTEGFIETEFQRLVISIPIGGTVTQTIQAPTSRILKYISIDNTMIDIHDRLITVTLTIDQHNTVYNQIPMTRDIEIQALFFPYIQDRIEYTLINNGAAIAEFTEDLQLISIDKAFYDEVLNPIFEGQFRGIREFARRFGR